MKTACGLMREISGCTGKMNMDIHVKQEERGLFPEMRQCAAFLAGLLVCYAPMFPAKNSHRAIR